MKEVGDRAAAFFVINDKLHSVIETKGNKNWHFNWGKLKQGKVYVAEL